MAQGSVRIWVVAALIALGTCAEPPTPAPAPAAQAAPAPPPPAPTASAAPSTPADRCGAAPLQYLVGKPRTQIPVPVNPGMRRVVCSTCMITQDYVEGRQTITYDTQSGLVTSVRCG